MRLEAVFKLLACVVLFLPDVTRAQTEPPAECAPGGHSVLRDPYRSTTFSSSWLQQSALQDFICDHSLAAGWYQFQIFDKPASMPTRCVEVNHCGTQAPVWLSLGDGESLPGPLEVRQLTACAAWQLFAGLSKECCMFRIPVTVRNCGGFYVYLLQPTQGCMGYCAQEMADASPTAWPAALAGCGPDGTCKKRPPPPPSAPVIVPEVTGDSVHLKCVFGSSSNGSLGYVVGWSRLSLEGRKEELKQETTIRTSAYIELDGFNLRLGDKIYCSCTSFLLDSPTVRGASVQSQEFFAGILLRPEESSVSEDGRLYQLSVESTVPVPCPLGSSSSSTERCTLSLQLSTSSAGEGSLGADVSLSSCAVELSRGPCGDGVCSRALIHFSPVTDFVRDGNRTTRISVKPIVTQNALWNGYSPEPVEITVKDVPSAYCYSFTDPHVITFDGRHYDNYQVGTFVLYKSTARPFEVHVRQWECGSVAHAGSCACGFAARDGGDVVAFDMCDGEWGETRPHLSVRHRDLSKSGIRIAESYQGRKVTVTFSSGAFVRADVSDWGMSLTLRAPGSDRGRTEGLCGTFDGRLDNELHSAGGATVEHLHAFISEWRLPPGGSLFDTAPSHLSGLSPRQHCDCRAGPRLSSPRGRSSQGVTSSDSTCSPHGNVRLPGVIPALDVTAEYIGSVELMEGEGQTPPPAGHSGRGGGAGASDSTHQSLSQSDLEGFTYFFPEDHEAAAPPDASPKWPTPSGLTERRAAAQCRRAVAGSGVASGCRRLLDRTIVSRAEAMCVADLRLKDEQSWLSAAVPLLENECERRLTEESGAGKEDREVLAVLRCPDLCSGNGQCSEWGCVCFPGFGSYDCSVHSDQIPEITALEKEGLCDVRRGDCSPLRVHGQGFKDSYELRCEFVKEKFEDGAWLLDKPRFVPAVFLNVTALECQLPPDDSWTPAGRHPETETERPLARWQIKVSNDGYSSSNAKILTLYDGACQICSLHTAVLCTLRERTCSIDGVCYSEGESSPSSTCLACVPDSSKHAWSIAEKNKPPELQPLHLWSFQGETFVYQLQARDPEGSAVLFTLESGPEGASLSPAGLLTWKASAEASAGASSGASAGATDAPTFRVTVADSCGAETRASIQVSVRPCECLNGGSCVTNADSPRGSAEHRCSCPDGFTGERCEVDVDDCKPNPCRLGRCIDGPDSFSCVCPTGTTGRTCREDVDECVSRPCFPGVGCNNTFGSFTCGGCPQGYSGDGRTCSLQAMTSGARVPQAPPRPRASGSSACSSRPCHPGVHCFESTHVSAGFVCGPCPTGLHGNGRTCTATGGTGDGPIFITKSSSGKESTPTSSSSSSSSPRRLAERRTRPEAPLPREGRVSSTDVPAGAELRPDLTPAGGKRGRCPYDYTGDGVACKAVCRYRCGRNMECTLPNTCACKEGYTGHSCHIAMCRPDCKNQGKCVRPDVCECAAGHGGPTCEEASCEPPCRHGGTCLARNLCTCPYGYVGPRCEIMVCNRHCENGGECVSPDVCECQRGWYGPTCNSALCDPVCLNGGACTKPNVCACPAGFYGSQCQIAVCSPPCKNGGQCMRNNVCSCPEGYTGKRCQKSVCEPMCMNRGKCVGPHTCSCASGWRGKRCNIPVCLQKCKNGGECLGPNTCHCPSGWGGLQCQTPVCKQRCLNGGRCVLPDYCHCRRGYNGLTCALKALQA
ncbi:vwde [Pungitius sinensis]